MFIEESNEEWRQWIKLTEKKESISSTSLRDSAIDLLLRQVVELQKENAKLTDDNYHLTFRLNARIKEVYKFARKEGREGWYFSPIHLKELRKKYPDESDKYSWWTKENAISKDNSPTHEVDKDE